MSPEVMQVGARLNQRSRAKFVADAKKRVARGAKWLDTERPRWWRMVRTTHVHMAVSTSCILGQLYAKDADESRLSSDGFDFMRQRHRAKMLPLGFNTKYGGPTFDELQAAWLHEIATRRKAAKKATATR